MHFKVGVHRTARLLQQNSGEPLFYYVFSLDTKLNAMKILFPKISPGIPYNPQNFASSRAHFLGASHADDLPYLFKNKLTPTIEPGSPEDVAVRRMTKLWTNFAKHGDPNPAQKDPSVPVEWKSVARDAFNFLNIGEELIADVNPDAERMALWEGIYKEYGRSGK